MRCLLNRDQKGFTLVEVVLVVGIIATVGAIAALSFPPLIDAYRLRQASVSFMDSIREAQIRAFQEARLWRVVLDDDRKGYTIQFASDPALATSDCDSAGWAVWRHRRFPDTVTITSSSRACIAFDSSGRAKWPNPEILKDTDPPMWGRNPIRLVDGAEAELTNPLYQPSTVVWDRSSSSDPVRVTVDVNEERYFETLCIGMFSYEQFLNFGYPDQIHVQAAPDGPYPPAEWTTILNTVGPPDPDGGQLARTCFEVPVAGTYRYFRLTFHPDGRYIILDEVHAGALIFEIASERDSRTAVVDPVTGRVTLN